MHREIQWQMQWQRDRKEIQGSEREEKGKGLCGTKWEKGKGMKREGRLYTCCSMLARVSCRDRACARWVRLATRASRTSKSTSKSTSSSCIVQRTMELLYRRYSRGLPLIPLDVHQFYLSIFHYFLPVAGWHQILANFLHHESYDIWYVTIFLWSFDSKVGSFLVLRGYDR